MPMTRQEFYRVVPYLTPLQLRDQIRNASEEERRLFEEYYGSTRFQRISDIVLASSIADSLLTKEATVRPNVVVIPGIMGSELAIALGDASPQLIWLHLRLLFSGRLDDLRLGPDGRSPVLQNSAVSSPGILSLYFDELIQFLVPNYNVRRFAYDWRRDIREVAQQLDTFIRFEFGDQPVHLIAHSMGGLVARAMLAGRLAAGTPRELVLGEGGRLVMLGTPNQGTYEALKILTGAQEAIELLAAGLQAASLFFTSYEDEVRRILDTVHSFPAVYQMLPRPELLPSDGAIDLYHSSGYSGLGNTLSDRHFQAARETHTLLDSAILPEAMRIVAGCDPSSRTSVGVTAGIKVGVDTEFATSIEGDGMVPHELTKLADVPIYFVSADHGDLMSLPAILGAMDDLLLHAPDSVPLSRTPISPVEAPEMLPEAAASHFESGERQALIQAVAEQSREVTDEDWPPSPEEIELRKLFVSGWLGGQAHPLFT